MSSAQAFARSREGLASPDIQLLFSPASYDQNKFGELEREPGMTIAVSIARPESRGTIMAKSPDPFVRPSLKPNYLSVPNDLRVSLAGIALARRIFAAPALARHSVQEITPGPGVSTQEALTDYIRQQGTTIYHIVGTCKMGEDPMAVVDSRLKVRGLDRTARHRRLHHAGGDHCQHQCADHHDRREGRGHDPAGCRYWLSRLQGKGFRAMCAGQGSPDIDRA